MKPVGKAKSSLAERKAKAATSSGCGRMKYSGVDMAFIYVRGKRMLTMSEVARKLYSHWPRATLYDRVKQMNFRKHTCSPREIERVLSVNGVAKLGIHCTLISKEDLDAFGSVYKANQLPVTTAGNALKAGKAGQGIAGKKQVGHIKQNSHTSVSLKARGKTNVLSVNIKPKDKSTTRVVKCEKASGRKPTHVVPHGINKASDNKQIHVVINKTARFNGVSKQSQNSPTKQLNGIRKRKYSASKGNEKATLKRNHGATKTARKESCSPPSDCASFDSGISSLALDTAKGKSKTISKSKVDKSQLRGTKRKNETGGPKSKDFKTRDGQLKNLKSGLKRKREKVKRETGFKKAKVSQCNNKPGADKITKDFIMKMDLKSMNDKELIHSFSLASSPFSTPDKTPCSEDSSYLVKLMPVKPVWRINSNFKFISNFLLPPSLVVRDGELKPACSMACTAGQRPPTAHPIWKWKIGEPVIGNKTEISYKMKKVKCVDSQTK